MKTEVLTGIKEIVDYLNRRGVKITEPTFKRWIVYFPLERDSPPHGKIIVRVKILDKWLKMRRYGKKKE